MVIIGGVSVDQSAIRLAIKFKKPHTGADAGSKKHFVEMEGFTATRKRHDASK